VVLITLMPRLELAHKLALALSRCDVRRSGDDAEQEASQGGKKEKRTPIIHTAAEEAAQQAA
jgi:hypothetical protein